MNQTKNASWDILLERVDLFASDLVIGNTSELSIDPVMASLQEVCGNGCESERLFDAAIQLKSSFHLNEGGNRQQFLSDSITNLQTAIASTRIESENPPLLRNGKATNLVPLWEDPDLVRDFILESMEHLSTIENGLLKIEEDPNQTEPIHSVFRSFHTIKGLAGFLELDSIREVAHEVETVLDLARNLKMKIGPAVVDVVLASADYLRQAIKSIEEGLVGVPRKLEPIEPLLNRIRSLGETKQEIEKRDAIVIPPVIPKSTKGIRNCSNPKSDTTDTLSKMIRNSEPGVVLETTNKTAKVEQAGHLSNFAIRVETAKLDHLLNMVGELVIAQSMVKHEPSLNNPGNARLQAHLTQLNRITDEVQKMSMTLRMVPIGTLFQRMKRLVRDLARKGGKQADLEVIGEDTELDKTVVDGLADPLMHMVRNALDHGVEPSADRIALGKPAAAQIGLKANHQGGHMVIEVSDDGRGLNREKILAKARKNNRIGENTVLSDSEICHLIFEPGFSTADTITDISGRGVGMDVVKKSIHNMRGRVEIHSVPGIGTTFFIRLPLTLAIIDGLVVGVGIERYVVPIFAVTEMFRPTAAMLSSLEDKYEMVMVRGRLLPIVRLHKRFSVVPKNEDPCNALFIVVEQEGKRFCLMVDEFIGKQEVVIKNLGECFKNVSGVAGGAILGDGRVGLILEIAGLVESRAEAA